MKKVFAVIGANYGDEGKGITTDYLCHKHGVTLVVRFNGGAQAGHTVCIGPKSEVIRHDFHHIGSGHFTGANTYLAEEFIVNPFVFRRELIDIQQLKPNWLTTSRILVNGECIVTTPYDMFINRASERSRGEKAHGSCGLGINETVTRNSDRSQRYGLKVKDLSNPEIVMEKLTLIGEEWYDKRLDYLRFNDPSFGYIDRKRINEDFVQACIYFLGHTIKADDRVLADNYSSILFEGAQGLLLDQNRTQDMPYLTRSNTGLQNVVRLLHSGLRHLDIDFKAYYVTRSFVTRHGNGPLPNEVEFELGEDLTNTANPYQGKLRYAYFTKETAQQLADRISKDFEWTKLLNLKHSDYGVAITHMDEDVGEQSLFEIKELSNRIELCSYGPNREDMVNGNRHAFREIKRDANLSN